jgi:hypothetical protein
VQNRVRRYFENRIFVKVREVVSQPGDRTEQSKKIFES